MENEVSVTLQQIKHEKKLSRGSTTCEERQGTEDEKVRKDVRCKKVGATSKTEDRETSRV